MTDKLAPMRDMLQRVHAAIDTYGGGHIMVSIIAAQELEVCRARIQAISKEAFVSTKPTESASRESDAHSE